MRIKLAKLHSTSTLIVTAVISYVIVWAIFWNRYALSRTSDFDTYVTQSGRFSLYLLSQIRDPIDWFALSASFHLIYEWLSLKFGDAEYALFILSVSSTLILLRLAIRRFSKGYVIPLLLFLHPRFLDLVVGQSRMALALAVFAISTQRRSNFAKLILSIVALSLHLGILIILTLSSVYSLSEWARNRFKLCNLQLNLSERRYGIAKVIGVGLLPLGFFAAASAGVISSVTGNSYEASGWLYIVMWILTSLWILSLAPSTLSTASGFQFHALIALASVGLIVNVYSTRLIALSIFFLIISTSTLSSKKQKQLFPVILLNLLLSYGYWL